MLKSTVNKNVRVGTAAKEDRSRMNICFVMAPEYKDFEADFLKFATEKRNGRYQGDTVLWVVSVHLATMLCRKKGVQAF